MARPFHLELGGHTDERSLLHMGSIDSEPTTGIFQVRTGRMINLAPREIYNKIVVLVDLHGMGTARSAARPNAESAESVCAGPVPAKEALHTVVADELVASSWHCVTLQENRISIQEWGVRRTPSCAHSIRVVWAKTGSHMAQALTLKPFATHANRHPATQMSMVGPINREAIRRKFGSKVLVCRSTGARRSTPDHFQK